MTARDAKVRAVDTPHVVTRHRSVLMRKLGSVDMQLQRNKVTNLRLAVRHLDGRVLAPGETLSFWRCIGQPRASDGYLPGLVLMSDGFASDIGGGLCQLANLLYWMALHTPLEVIEHHHHGVDAFPDSGRQLPFGSGATVFYNYVDLVLRNPTQSSFRVKVWITDEHLCGEIRCSALPKLAYHVREEGHRFFRRRGRIFRENWLYRVKVDRATGAESAVELLTHNVFPVMYEPDPAVIEDDDRKAVAAAV
jgi:vancomycin resistance protein VanW